MEYTQNMLDVALVVMALLSVAAYLYGSDTWRDW